jgi:hypothetical protein
MRYVPQKAGRVAAAVLTGLLVPAAVGAVGIVRATGEVYTPRSASAPPVSVDAVVPPAHDPAKPTAVIVLSLHGTNVADALGPYEVLADTGSGHGLTAPRADLASAASGLDRLVVPGTDAVQRAAADGLSLPERLPQIYLHTEPGFAFDAALRDIARTWDVATAQWEAKTLQYPNTNPQLSGPSWPWALTVRPILIAGAAVLLSILISQLIGRRPRGPGSADQDLDQLADEAGSHRGGVHATASQS